MLLFAFLLLSCESASVLLPIPPRHMWGWGSHPTSGVDLHGYCGECSFQSVGLFYGNYISQELVRYATGNEELLIGANDQIAADALKYTYEEWNFRKPKPPQNAAFLNWVKAHVDNGVPPIAGWFERQPSGDVDYDHIMPIVGYGTTQGDEGTNVTALYHNDFYLPTVSIMTAPNLDSSRKSCHQTAHPVQPYTYCLPHDYDYAIALTGIVDENNETFRTVLNISRWNEPDWGAEDGKHETPVMISANATVRGLTLGVGYAIVMFDTPEAVPSKGFLAAAWARKTLFTATGETMVVVLDDFLSDGSFFYRTVVVG